MVAVVARRGRDLQRYTSNGRRLVVGCIPYKFKADSPSKDAVDQALEVLVISSQKGQDILFPKGGWESDESIQDAALREAMEEAGVQGTVERILGKWRYKSKTQDTYKLGYMFPLNVTEEMLHWPEMESRKRRWVTVGEARETCQQPWMRKALDKLVKRLSDSTGSNRASARVTPLHPCNNRHAHNEQQRPTRGNAPVTRVVRLVSELGNQSGMYIFH